MTHKKVAERLGLVNIIIIIFLLSTIYLQYYDIYAYVINFIFKFVMFTFL